MTIHSYYVLLLLLELATKLGGSSSILLLPRSSFPLVISLRRWRAVWCFRPCGAPPSPRRVSSSLSSLPATIVGALPFIFVRVAPPVARMWWMGSRQRKVHLLFGQHLGDAAVRPAISAKGPDVPRRRSDTGAPRPDPSIEHTRNLSIDHSHTGTIE